MAGFRRVSSVCCKCLRRLEIKPTTRRNFVSCRAARFVHNSFTFPPTNRNTTVPISVINVRWYSNEADDTDLIEMNYDDVISGLQNKSITFIDIREPYELEMMGTYHPAAVHIPMGELEAALEMSPDKFKSLYRCEQPEEDDTIVFGCYSGIRSLTALMLARQLGFEKAKHYPGGFQEWMQKTKKDEEG